jgi:hypothetical protein
MVRLVKASNAWNASAIGFADGFDSMSQRCHNLVAKQRKLIWGVFPIAVYAGSPAA